MLICSSCCNNIRNLYEFRNICVKNKNLFKGYVHRLNQGNEFIKPANLIVSLNKCDSIEAQTKPKINCEMTYNEVNTSQENFIFNMSTSEEYRLENCIPVCASPMNDIEYDQNIQDLSQSTSFLNSNMYDQCANLDNNTDGEITNMIESFCGMSHS